MAAALPGPRPGPSSGRGWYPACPTLALSSGDPATRPYVRTAFANVVARTAAVLAQLSPALGRLRVQDPPQAPRWRASTVNSFPKCRSRHVPAPLASPKFGAELLIVATTSVYDCIISSMSLSPCMFGKHEKQSAFRLAISLHARARMSVWVRMHVRIGVHVCVCMLP